MDNFFASTHNTFGKIDVLIANAGIASRRHVKEVDEKYFIDGYKEKIPTGNFAKPEEIASVAIYLSSPAAASIIGIDLVIDGGFTSIMKE